MNYLRVEMPILRVQSLREAEADSELATDVYSRDDTLLAEKGETISRDDLDRFRNFRVRAVTVVGFQERWVPGDKGPELPEKARVVEEADFSDALAQIVDSLQGRESLDYLVDMTRYLRRVARRLGREEREQQLDNLLDQARSVREDYVRILDELDDLDEDTEPIEEVLFDSSASTGEEFMDLPFDKSFLKRVIQTSNERLQVVAPLVDIASDLSDEMGVEQATSIDPAPFPPEFKPVVRNLNEGLLHEAVEECPTPGAENRPEWKTELHQNLSRERSRTLKLVDEVRELSGTEATVEPVVEALEGQDSLNPKILDSLLPNRSNLIDRIGNFMEDRIDNREDIWDLFNKVGNDVMESNTEKRIFMNVTSCLPEERETGFTPPEDALTDAERLVNSGEYLEAVHRLLEGLREIGGGQTKLEGELMMYGEDFEELLQRREEIEDTIEVQVASEEKQTMLRTVLSERENYKPDHLLNIDTDMILLEEIDSFKSKEINLLEKFDEYLRELKEQAETEAASV